MYYTGYLEDMLTYAGRVYIDTCSLMETERIEQFIEAAEEVFLQYDKQMTVLGSVVRELENFLQSADYEKRRRAEDAFMLMNEHYELFRVKDGDSDCGDFADPEILAELVRSKGDCGQLLITNDKKLAKDAFQLNRQESNHGQKIMVCHLNYYGNLCRCDCTKERVEGLSATAEVAEFADIPKVDVPQQSAASVKVKTDAVPTKKHRWKLPAAIAGGFAGGLVSGIAFERYAVPVIRRAMVAL